MSILLLQKGHHIRKQLIDGRKLNLPPSLSQLLKIAIQRVQLMTLLRQSQHIPRGLHRILIDHTHIPICQFVDNDDPLAPTIFDSLEKLLNRAFVLLPIVISILGIPQQLPIGTQQTNNYNTFLYFRFLLDL